MNTKSKFFKNLFTEVDNRTFDLTKVLAALSVLIALGLSIFVVVYRGETFNMTEYGMGIAAVFAGTAALLGFKKDTKVCETDSIPENTETKSDTDVK